MQSPRRGTVPHDLTNSSAANPYQPPASPPPPSRPISRDAFAICISYVVVAGLGCTFLFNFWFSEAPTVAILRTVGFAVIMAGIHFVGYRLWIRQQTSRAMSDSPAQPDIGSQNVPGGLLLVILLVLLWLFFFG